MTLQVRWNQFAARCPYCAFFLVGSVIGLAALAVREILDAIGDSDSPRFYATTVGIVNALGVITAFFAHRKFTFVSQKGRGSLQRFVLIALFGIGVSSGLSVVLRYGLAMDDWLGQFAPAMAFAIAVILASGVTFYLNARWNFSGELPPNIRPAAHSKGND